MRKNKLQLAVQATLSEAEEPSMNKDMQMGMLQLLSYPPLANLATEYPRGAAEPLTRPVTSEERLL